MLDLQQTVLPPARCVSSFPFLSDILSIREAERLAQASNTVGLHSCAGGLQEVRRLEKLRAKRAFEASLPAIDDVARLPERQAMIEAWEVQEWMEREEEIKGVQEERLSLLAQGLQVCTTSP